MQTRLRLVTAQPQAQIARFTKTERAVHWVHASAFLTMLGSGLVLYVPALAIAVNRRPLVKDVHVYTAVAWLAALALVLGLGNSRSVRQSLAEAERFDADDGRWLLGRGSPQGRFNAGQKINIVLTVAFAILFTVSGFDLWYGERNTAARLSGASFLHDSLTYMALLLFIGHLYFAVFNPATRHSLRGMTTGSVDAEWAARHHAKWAREAERR
jgi:formate dehydrogenase subunit gamma